MLQTEEKRLKVKIAEMAIQEIRFRIRALNEDVRRADELHELHLALATVQAVSRVESANAILQERIYRDAVIRNQWQHYYYYFFFLFSFRYIHSRYFTGISDNSMSRSSARDISLYLY